MFILKLRGLSFFLPSIQMQEIPPIKQVFNKGERKTLQVCLSQFAATAITAVIAFVSCLQLNTAIFKNTFFNRTQQNLLSTFCFLLKANLFSVYNSKQRKQGNSIGFWQISRLYFWFETHTTKRFHSFIPINTETTNKEM